MNRLLDQVSLLPMTSPGDQGQQLEQHSYVTMDKSACLDRRKKCLQPMLVVPLTVGVLLLILLYTLRPASFFFSQSSSSSSSFSTNDLHYSVVVDAGSSGSRAYLYFWPSHSGDPHELLQISPLAGEDGNPLYKKVTPGLSSLQDNPNESLAYIRPLLEFALAHIPADKVHETPLYILATAGMRMVERSKQEALVTTLREGISQHYEFLFPEGNLEVISGKQEGIYQWLAINYVLGKFRHQERKEMVVLDKEGGGVFRPRTVGAIDMGGASMQIAMEVTSQQQIQGMTEQEKSQVAEINLGCKDHDTEHTYRIFVTTFLGYGANEALARHRRNLILSQIERGETSFSGFNSSSRLSDPCLPLDMTEDVSINLEAAAAASTNLTSSLRQQLQDQTQVYFSGTGDWEQCYRLLKDFTKRREKLTRCGEGEATTMGTAACHDEGIKVPLIQFEKSEFYAFSEFWYSMEDVLKMGGPYIFSKYQPAAKEFCQIPWSTTWKNFKDGHFPKADADRIRTQCFKSSWLTVALHEGFGFPSSYSHLSAAPETVNGQVVHWTVGALLYRTRFIPLREIESRSQEQVHHGTYHSPWASGYLYSHYVIFACLVLVVGAILLYLERLKRYVRPSTLRKVPSLSFWIPSSEMYHRQEQQRGMEPLLSVVATDGHSRKSSADFSKKLFYT